MPEEGDGGWEACLEHEKGKEHIPLPHFQIVASKVLDKF